MKEEMEKLGLFEQYQTELDFIAVRHFFYRFWKLLTNYETDQKELKLQLINELFDYMESNIPDWENNHYVRYSLPATYWAAALSLWSMTGKVSFW